MASPSLLHSSEPVSKRAPEAVDDTAFRHQWLQPLVQGATGTVALAAIRGTVAWEQEW